jgi:predicted nucleotidyltransferase
MNAPWPTLTAIKAAEVSRMTSGVIALKAELDAFARKGKGQFLIYGSVVRSQHRFDSDVDVLVDFPAEALTEAWRFCEDACRRHGLRPDVRPKHLCSPEFLKRVSARPVEVCGER